MYFFTIFHSFPITFSAGGSVKNLYCHFCTFVVIMWHFKNRNVSCFVLEVPTKISKVVKKLYNTIEIGTRRPLSTGIFSLKIVKSLKNSQVTKWSGDKVEFWQNLEKNASHIIIFLPHYMWAENE